MIADAPSGRLLAELAPPSVLNHLELTIVRRLEGYLRGEHLGLLPGPGSDLAEARLYRPGEDDVRHMDWAVTARTTQAHVRDVTADRELETYALIDLTASMHFGTALQPDRVSSLLQPSGAGTEAAGGDQPSSRRMPWRRRRAAPEKVPYELAQHAWDKRDLAVAAVATVGTLTARLGDRFGGYVLTDNGFRRHEALSGRSALYGLVRSMLAGPRMPSTIGGDAAPPDLGDAIRRMARAHPRRGMRVVVSDFLDDTPAGETPPWVPQLQRLAMRHQVLAVEIVDPREQELPNIGIVELMDPETGRVVELDTRRDAVREAFRSRAQTHRDHVQQSLRQAGVAHLVLRTDSDWVRDTARFVLSHRHHAARLHGPARGVVR